MTAHPDHHYYIEEGFRQQQERRIREAYIKFWQQEVNWVKKNGGSREDGEDFFQLAMKEIASKANDTSFILHYPFSLYLHGICRNQWYKELKKRKKHKEAESIWSEYEKANPDLAKEIDKAELTYLCFKLKEETFQQLTELCQKVLKYHSEGKTAEEIGNILDKEPNAISQRIFRCRSRWIQLMKASPLYKYCKNLMS